jgi:hypothetical protein
MATEHTMHVQAARDMLAVTRAERQRRIDALEAVDTDWRWDQWTFSDEPFVNEMCLVLLVSIRHLLERELVRLGARVSADGEPIPGKEYWRLVASEREALRRRDGWKKLAAKLNLASFASWNGPLETLRLLANTYKHEPGYATPGEELLTHLGLNPIISTRPTVTYASLPESQRFREALALHLGLAKDADYTDIAEEFLNAVENFVAAVERQPHIAAVAPTPVRLDEFAG